MRLYFFGFWILILGGCACREPNWVKQIEKGDYGGVKLGTYPYTTSQKRYDSEEFTELRKEIEDKVEFLSQIVRHFYPEEAVRDTGIQFKYKFAAKDGDKIILRYFARIPETKGSKPGDPSHQRFAGYSLQFVFLGRGKEVCEIYLFRTPLE